MAPDPWGFDNAEPSFTLGTMRSLLRWPALGPFALTMAFASAAPGCGGTAREADPPPSKASTATSPALPEIVRPARLFVLPQDEHIRSIDVDGRRRGVAYGVRFVDHADGRLAQAREVLPAGAAVQSIVLPDRLGGGYLFVAASEMETQLWRTGRWDGPLAVLKRLPFQAKRVELGFDRIYAIDGREAHLVGLDPATGEEVGLGPLPESSSYGRMAFADAWMGAVEVGVRGVLLTFDAGASWRGPGFQTSVPAISRVDGRIVLHTPRGMYALETNGVLRKLGGLSGDGVFAGAVQMASALDPGEEAAGAQSVVSRHRGSHGPFTRRPLLAAVLRGFPDSPHTAIVAEDGALARVALEDGRLLDVQEQAYDASARCQAMPLGSGIGFVCGDERGATLLYAYEEPLAMRLIRRFAGPRMVSSSGNGALTVRGRCDEEVRGDEPGAVFYCLIDSRLEAREIRVRGDVGAERIVALRDGRAAILVPPRLGAPGALTLIERDGSSSAVKLVLPRGNASKRALLEQGLWLDGFAEGTSGELMGWVGAGGPFVGVRVTIDGKVRVGPVQDSLESALIAGRYALLLGPTGISKETTDGGFDWRSVELPQGLEDRLVGLPAAGAVGASEERGCSAVGCAFSNALRVGWQEERGRPDLIAAGEPPKPERARVFYVNWSLDCSPTGSASGPDEALVARDARVRARSGPARPRPTGTPTGRIDLESSAWRPFLGSPAPHFGGDYLGFDYGTEEKRVQLRGYVWGPRAASWERAGRWVVRAADRFSVRDAIWSTEPTRSPWPDVVVAAQAFGSDPSHRSTSDWFAELDPMGEGGMLLVRAQGTTKAFVLEKDRTIVAVRDAAEWGLDSIAGVVKIGDAWYVGSASGPREFRVLRIDADRVSLIGAYPIFTDASPVRLVRGSRGDAIGLWTAARGRFGAAGAGDDGYVFPVQLATGEVSAPTRIPRERLLGVPRACDAEDEGWVLIHEVSPSVTSVELRGTGASRIRATQLEARLLADRDGVCVSGLATQVEGAAPRGFRPVPTKERDHATIAMAVTDRATDRRWGFRCSR